MLYLSKYSQKYFDYEYEFKNVGHDSKIYLYKTLNFKYDTATVLFIFPKTLILSMIMIFVYC